MKILRRVLIISGVALAIVTIGSYWIAPIALSLYAARKAPPVARVGPRELKDTAISQVAGEKLSYFGYEFDIPWNDLDKSQTKLYPTANPNRVVLTFRSGLRLSVTAVPAKEFVDGLSKDLHTSPQRLETVFGLESSRSDYAFVQRLYQITPDKMHCWSLSPSVHVKENLLLLLKSVSLSRSANSGIYAIQNQSYKGFQQGDPQSQSGEVLADLYADDGAVEFLFLQQGNQKEDRLTQPEINRVVQSLRKRR